MRFGFRIFQALFVLFLFSAPQPAGSQIRFELQALPDEESRNLQLWYAQVEWLKLHPIPVNTASIGEILQIPGVTEEMARFLITYRTRHGPFRSKSEVQQALRLSSEDWHWLAPFLRVNQKNPATGARLRLRLGPALRGFPLPSHAAQYQRLWWTGKREFSGGVLFVRRPSGSRFTTHTVGFFTLPLGRTTRLWLGHYFLRFGEGLLFNLPYFFGKGQSPAQLLRTEGSPVRGDLSALNGFFLQGGAVHVRRPRWRGTFFYSENHWQATFDSLTGTAHLLASQSPSAFCVRERLGGGHFQIDSPFGSLGATGFQSLFSKPVIGLKNATPLRRLSMWGVNGRFFFSRFTLTGAWAQSPKRKASFLLKGAVRLTRFEWVWLVRHFGTDFWNPHATVFGEQGEPTNETGVYAGIVLRPARATQLEAFLDQFLFPQGAQNLSNRTGWEWRIRWTQLWNRKFRTFLALAEKQKDNKRWVLRNGWETVPILAPRDRQKIRFFWWFSPRRGLRVKGQLQWVHVHWAAQHPYPSAKSRGFLFAQELRWKPAALFSIAFGWSLFQTDDYASRLYAYEPGLPGTFPIFLAYGTGSRAYILPQFFLGKRGAVALKFTLHNLLLKPGISYRLSPPEPRRQSFSLQADFRF